jgi:hydrogenase expression/formation protein HypC
VSSDPAPHCDAASGCITCGDVAVPMRVIRVGAGALAVCTDDADATEDVAVDLIMPVQPGDRVLVHAGVAIGRLEEEPA